MNTSAHTPGRASLALVLFSTFVTFCAFYAPQPLLPLLARVFSVSATSVALLITVTFICLCVAPLAFGVLLQHISAKRLLILSTLILGLLQLAFAASDSFQWLLFTRTLQALVYPAIFTAAVTYCAKAGDSNQIATRVSWYVATTIVGGMGGRLLGGFVSSHFHWRTTFVVLGVALAACGLSLLFARQDLAEDAAPKAGDKPVSRRRFLQDIGAILAQPNMRYALAVIFVTYFTFSALLNTLPFRMVDLEADISTARISLVYLGYSVGVVFAARASSITAWFGGERRALWCALSIYITGLVLISTPHNTALVAVGFLTAAGFFSIHATVSAYVNKLQVENAGMVNGIYISWYYLAGASGSLLPVVIYKEAGWNSFVATLTLTAALGYLALRKLGPAVKGV